VCMSMRILPPRDDVAGESIGTIHEHMVDF
jgi:hypothetical protein